MLARLLSVTIILFWITMTALLVRSEVWPNRSRLRTLPIEHIARLLWLHEQASALTIWSDGTRVGHLTLHPKLRKEDGVRILEYSGNLQMHMPGSRRQRLSWDGIVEFDQNFELRSFLIGLGVREPSLMRAEISVKPSENQAHYRLLNAGLEVEQQDYSLDETGVKKVLAQLDLDPELYSSVRGSAVAPSITAQQSSMRIREERIDTFLLSVKQGGQTLIEAHVSQLGQVLSVKTLVGYTMAPEDLAP